MKHKIKLVMANLRPIVQIALLIIAFFLPVKLGIVENFKAPEAVASADLQTYILYYIWMFGDKAAGGILAFIVWRWEKRINKEYLFNRGNTYKNFPYWWYYVCAKFLGYSKCNLKRVPIYMQFKLVLGDTFDNYDCGNYEKKENDVIMVSRKNDSNMENEMNLIISDTYPISMEQIPVTKKRKYTIIISRDNANDTNRYDSPQLVKKVVNEMRNLPQIIDKVNVFATTNPQNTVNIVNEAFKLGERANVKCVEVFQQKRDGKRKFEEKGKIVYKQ